MSELAFIQLPRGEVCLQGAHATKWRTEDGRDVLFASSKPRSAVGTPIRGGVPLVFPWFGDDPEGRGRPAHGFARRVPWRLDQALTDLGKGRIVMTLGDEAVSRAIWPHAFALRAQLDFGVEFSIALTVTNQDRVPFRFEALFHTYLAVGDARKCEVRGLRGVRYYDKLAGNMGATQTDELLRFAGECDRTYVKNESACTLFDPVLQRTLTVRQENAPSTVVWNPWIEKTKRLSDLGADDWQRFVCIESGCVMDDAVTLAPGASHHLCVRITSSN